MRGRLLGFVHEHGVSWLAFMTAVLRRHIVHRNRSAPAGEPAHCPGVGVVAASQALSTL